MENVKPVYTWAIYSLLLLTVVALAGFTLRLMPLAAVPFLNYEYLLHAHSHLAFLGWAYNALFVGLVWTFVPRKKNLLSKYNTLFWIMQAITVCMFIAFLTDGYKTPAIIALAAHTTASCFFMLYFLKDSKANTTGLPGLLVKAALFCLFLSSLGPFAIPVIKTNSMNPDHIKMAINFYLHFQYNGWFVFGVLALVVQHLPDAVRNSKWLKRGCALLLAGVVPAYFLSVQFIQLPLWVTLAAGLSGFATLAGALLIGLQLFRAKNFTGSHNKKLYNWLLFSFLIFAVKCLFLALSVFPGIYALVFHARNIMIAYLHWHFLGFITLTLLVVFGANNWLAAENRFFRSGSLLFIAGFLLQEIYLFAQSGLAWMWGVILPMQLEILLCAALLLLSGTLLLLLSGINHFQSVNKLSR